MSLIKFKTLKLVTLSITLLIGMSACNKAKTISKKFIKTGEWTITELSVDGVNEDELPTWEINDCDIYAESCSGEWRNEEGGHTKFIWQFREKANTFEISHQKHEEEHDNDHASEEVAEQAFNFSGVYEVIERKKDAMEFTSKNTVGYSGQKVIIKIQKK
jgi:hypothetical protein